MKLNQLREFVKQVVREEQDYQQLFKHMLDKYGKSIADMSDDEKKKFFNAVDTAYKAKSEGRLKEYKVVKEGYTVRGDNPSQFVQGAYAVLSAYLRDEDLGSKEEKMLKDVISNLEYLAKYFHSKRNEGVSEGLSKDAIVRTLSRDKDAYFLSKDGNDWILDITPKAAQQSTFHQKFNVKDLGKGHLGMKYKLSELTAGQKKIDVDGDGEIEGSDLAALRKNK